MELPKPVHPPSTIIGIVSNILAMTLVCALLYTEPRSDISTLQQVAGAIRAIAKTKQVTLDNILEIMGKPLADIYYGADGWSGSWDYPIGNAMSNEKLAFTMVFHYKNIHGNEGYQIDVVTTHIYFTGFKHLYKNAERAFGSVPRSWCCIVH